MKMRLAWALLGSMALTACGDDTGGGGGGSASLKGEGEACTDDAECAEGLECDLDHEEATCEVPHGHGAPASSSSGGEGAGGGGEGGAGAGGGSGGGEPATPCELLCTCLEASCSSFDAYPYADGAACLAACEAYSDEEISCYGGFCDQAAQNPTEHACEHAWGDLGLDEC